ncbi:glutathione S-transferase family protein [Paraburkholderia sp. CNPSo 3076]|uniref:glutathione S-transferase family protein n=1 Tax=Paraburkholderia sp. CNPSo 3076 TaxID=2940936 RepID=UPI00225BCF34|nr:glutathione S-transferase family protein [Paraburkholderia sp. CNPSo 3076]MCX5544118.1 glutathione S-transferase family protein [Paraburkholderia sp. CNPSo 3076]
MSEDKLTLYNWATSTCSQKVRFVLAEKALPYEDYRVDALKSEHLSDRYLKLNPNGVVPTLTHGLNVIIDSSVIAEYLDEVFGDVPLSPVDAYGRARMRAWRQFIDEVPTAAIRVPSFNGYIKHLWANKSDEELESLNAKRTVRKHFYEHLGREGSSQGEEARSVEMLRETVVRMDRALADGPWMVGEQFTLADITLVPTLVRMSDIGLARVWHDLPRVADWLARVERRPAFSQAFYPGSRFETRGTHPLATHKSQETAA